MNKQNQNLESAWNEWTCQRERLEGCFDLLRAQYARDGVLDNQEVEDLLEIIDGLELHLEQCRTLLEAKRHGVVFLALKPQASFPRLASLYLPGP